MPTQEVICRDTGQGRGGASGRESGGEEVPSGAGAKSPVAGKGSRVLAPTCSAGATRTGAGGVGSVHPHRASPLRDRQMLRPRWPLRQTDQCGPNKVMERTKTLALSLPS